MWLKIKQRGVRRLGKNTVDTDVNFHGMAWEKTYDLPCSSLLNMRNAREIYLRAPWLPHNCFCLMMVMMEEEEGRGRNRKTCSKY